VARRNLDIFEFGGEDFFSDAEGSSRRNGGEPALLECDLREWEVEGDGDEGRAKSGRQALRNAIAELRWPFSILVRTLTLVALAAGMYVVLALAVRDAIETRSPSSAPAPHRQPHKAKRAPRSRTTASSGVAAPPRTSQYVQPHRRASTAIASGGTESPTARLSPEPTAMARPESGGISTSKPKPPGPSQAGGEFGFER
jgi:hypothetical protein